jgi:hypothetical protein
MAYVIIVEPSLLAPLVTRMLVQASTCWDTVNVIRAAIMAAIMVVERLLCFIDLILSPAIGSCFRPGESVALWEFFGKELNSDWNTSRFGKSGQ